VQTKRLVALVLGVALVITFGAFVVSGDIGAPSVPDDAVAVVEGAPEGTISTEEFDANLRQAAFNLQLRELPPEDDPQFEQVEQAALSNAIQGRWVRGEAEDRGIEVDEREVDQAFDSIVEEQLGGQQGFERFIERSEVDGEPAFTEEDVREVAELTAISDRLQELALPQEPPSVSDEDVERFYEANIEQFEVPETRDVRVILNPDVAEIEKAIGELEEDDSPEAWERVARKYSTDEATQGQGGLRRDVAEGQNEPALDEAIFSSEPGELVGPIEGESGSYVIQVEDVTAAETTPLEDVEQQITETLQQGLQTQEAEAFRTDFINKWTSRTFCAEDVLVELCANAEPAEETCIGDDEEELTQSDPSTLAQGCPAWATPRGAVVPGSASLFPGEQLAAKPQNACGFVSPPDATDLSAAEPLPCAPWPVSEIPEAGPALPPGVPIGPGGAPVPPTGAPPQGAPPAP
jgi:parvulin-like peptidyl-prolyl isomerase